MSMSRFCYILAAIDGKEVDFKRWIAEGWTAHDLRTHW